MSAICRTANIARCGSCAPPYTAARAGRLLTALCMEKKMQVEIRPCEGGWKFVHGEKTVCLQENQQQAEWQSI